MTEEAPWLIGIKSIRATLSLPCKIPFPGNRDRQWRRLVRMDAVICYSEAMKTGDKALVRLDGVVYEGTVKRFP